MVDEPTFYCSKTLLGYNPGPDLNRITLHGPEGMSFVMYAMGEPRAPDANQRCNDLAAQLTAMWEIGLINTKVDAKAGPRRS